ncbi:hypothetical protein B0J17DRAFT_702162 [Rhizoctonia solani]|nr:hypothetical protein B0J17DRAFT_702162 [Rhizoctonia solani]
MDSSMSTPEIISDSVSLVSDMEHTEGVRNHISQLNSDACCGGGNPSAGVTSPRVIIDDPNVVDMGHGDIELRVNNTIFKTHKYFLSKFTRFEEMIQNMRYQGPLNSTPCITVYRDERGVNDINNTFKYFTPRPFNFETPVLISALRVATAYKYDNLRAFAIQHLENVSLDAIQRIQLAREFGLSSWEDPAYKELFERENVITEEEAQVLGFAAFARVARAREDAVMKKGKLLKKEQEEKTRKEAEAKAKKDAEEKAKKEAEAKAKKETEERAKKEAEEKAKKEAEEKARKDAEEKAKKEAEEKAKREAEAKAKKETEEKAKREEAEERAKKEAEEKAKKDAEEKAKKEAEEKAKREAEEKAKKEAEANK